MVVTGLWVGCLGVLSYRKHCLDTCSCQYLLLPLIPSIPGPRTPSSAGAHMNAAVTFASCALGRMSWRKYPVYVLGQFLGSFTAAATIYGLFYSRCLALGHLPPTPALLYTSRLLDPNSVKTQKALGLLPSPPPGHLLWGRPGEFS